MASDLDDALRRTRQSYDDTPYLSSPMMRSHPGRLAARAHWSGIEAPNAETARVLEIGCASGGNIIPLAAAMPRASFLGVDLSPLQISEGEKRRWRLGLANVELRADSFEALGEADGDFDFIICHGVYSWIPEPLRDSLIRTVSERLTPSGVAMVSFNVLPGWRLFQIARDSMLLHARLTDDVSRRTEATRALFASLAAESANAHTYGKFWRDEAQRMAAGGDAYLAHEIFEDSNAPETFADFAARARRWGLDYLGEAAPVANNEADLAPDGAESIRALAGGDRLKQESYIDIFSGRSFREALLVKNGRIGASSQNRDLSTFHFIPMLDLELSSADESPDVYRLSAGKTEIFIDSAIAGPVLRRLVARRPASSRVADLAMTEDEVALALDLLPAAVENGLLAISALPVECAFRLSEHPKLWPFAATDVATSDRAVTRRHSAFQFSTLQRLLAPMTDGTRSRDDLVSAGCARAACGDLAVSSPEGPVADPAEIRKRLETAVDIALAGLLRNGLLVDP